MIQASQCESVNLVSCDVFDFTSCVRKRR